MDSIQGPLTQDGLYFPSKIDSRGYPKDTIRNADILLKNSQIFLDRGDKSEAAFLAGRAVQRLNESSNPRHHKKIEASKEIIIDKIKRDFKSERFMYQATTRRVDSFTHKEHYDPIISNKLYEITDIYRDALNNEDLSNILTYAIAQVYEYVEMIVQTKDNYSGSDNYIRIYRLVNFFEGLLSAINQSYVEPNDSLKTAIQQFRTKIIGILKERIDETLDLFKSRPDISGISLNLRDIDAYTTKQILSNEEAYEITMQMAVKFMDSNRIDRYSDMNLRREFIALLKKKCTFFTEAQIQNIEKSMAPEM